MSYNIANSADVEISTLWWLLIRLEFSKAHLGCYCHLQWIDTCLLAKDVFVFVDRYHHDPKNWSITDGSYIRRSAQARYSKVSLCVNNIVTFIFRLCVNNNYNNHLAITTYSTNNSYESTYPMYFVQGPSFYSDIPNTTITRTGVGAKLYSCQVPMSTST